MGFNIRRIIQSDFPQLIELFEEFAHFEKLPEKMTNSVEQMQEEQEFVNGFVAIDESENILGFATYFIAYYTWVGKSLYLDDLYVKEEFRGSGIGRKLLESVIQEAKSEKCKRMRWQVSSWNKEAQAFYKSIGAEIDDVEINCDLML